MGSTEVILWNLLRAAWLLPLASFVVIVLLGRKLGKEGSFAGVIATGAIVLSCVCSLAALGFWVTEHPLPSTHHETGEHASREHATGPHYDAVNVWSAGFSRMASARLALAQPPEGGTPKPEETPCTSEAS